MKYDSTDEKKLLKKFIEKKDNDAFVDLIKRYIPKIRRVIYTLLNGNIEEVEDAEQELIIALYKSIKSFNFESSFKTYLYRMAKNKAVDIIRKKKRDERLIRLISLNIFKRQEDPADQVILKDEKSKILENLFKLDKQDRMIIILKDIDSLSIKEISEILSLPEGTVKSRLHRSRMKLAGLLKEGNNER